jgi:hypothetical protein
MRTLGAKRVLRIQRSGKCNDGFRFANCFLHTLSPFHLFTSSPFHLFTLFTHYNGGISTPICCKIPRGAPPAITSGRIMTMLSSRTR